MNCVQLTYVYPLSLISWNSTPSQVTSHDSHKIFSKILKLILESGDHHKFSTKILKITTNKFNWSFWSFQLGVKGGRT